MPEFWTARPAPPGAPRACVGRLVETERLEWRIGDPGDPAAIAADFCARHDAPHTLREGSTCGVAVLISAAAGAAMIGAALGAPSPAPAVPDLALVAYRHGGPSPGPSSGTPHSGPGGLTVGSWYRSWDRGDHADAIAAVRDAIGRGEVYQACIVGHRRAPWEGDPAVAASVVQSIGGASWGGTIAGRDWMVASASPECFLLTGDGRASTRPIKGTAPATRAGRETLLASVKERAEHVMVVDLERNDLARVAVPGTVAVEGLFTLRRWADLWQAESTVTCLIDQRTDLADLLRAMCPPGSVTGTPKAAALDLIAALEPVGRGPAMGAFGYHSAGRLRLGLTIRTVALDAHSIHVWSGGGITWRSDPGAEVAEAEAKADAVTGALAG